MGYSTTTKSPSAFTWGAEVTANDHSTWILYEDYFPEGTKYVAVRYNSYDMNQLFFDDFSFVPVPEFCLPEDQCELTFILTDSYGDTWNGAAIHVMDVETGIILASMTNDYNNYEVTEQPGAYSQIKALSVCDGRELRFEWMSGSWDGECSYTVTDINGNVVFTGYSAMSPPFSYTVNCNAIVQTIALTAGTNWFSTYLDITLDELKAALLAAMPNNNATITIKSKTQNVKYQNGRWAGQLAVLDVAQMYKITVPEACEISLEGVLVDPSTLTLTITPGANWIAFPYSESMSVTNFFGSFPINNDVVKSKLQNTRYSNGRWAGQLNTLVPGQGYIYNSAATGDRTFTFPASAK